MKCDCGSYSVEYDDARDEDACNDCGKICIRNHIESAVEFNTNPDGSANICGQNIHYGKFPSQRVSINKARELITNISTKLCHDQSLIEMAVENYKTVLRQRMTNGINRNTTAAVCYYMAARKTQIPLLFIDISAKTNIRPNELERVYKRWQRKLQQDIPIQVPSIFVDDFVNKLELEPSESSVAATARKLLQAMRADAIDTNEKPVVVAATAVLIACRMHRFDRQYEDMKRSGLSTDAMKRLMYKWTRSSTAHRKWGEFDAAPIGGGDSGGRRPTVAAAAAAAASTSTGVCATTADQDDDDNDDGVAIDICHSSDSDSVDSDGVHKYRRSEEDAAKVAQWRRTQENPRGRRRH